MYLLFSRKLEATEYTFDVSNWVHRETVRMEISQI